MNLSLVAISPAFVLAVSLVSPNASADIGAPNPGLETWRKGDTSYFAAQTALGDATQIRTVMGISREFVRTCETLSYADGFLAGSTVAQESLIRIRDGIIVKVWTNGQEVAAPQHTTRLISRVANQRIQVMGRQVTATYSQYSASNYNGQLEIWTNSAIAPFGGLLIFKTPYMGGMTSTVTRVQHGPGNLPPALCPAHP
jgi:hypothetical protein